ncbi:methyl-accepting chemotaxis protein [Vibrio hannami]|uniref:methyl-accepting chemotaxis protein n=1 Tax=Vibrio hannami TaxID=2717094 RepID=UPI00241085E9|nr:methyl-accepting chemotaxis protein [Vibrio hannami]MDG3085815.1 methyl-accepting chemotaxis protein [Vibrio hannami]
MSQIMNFKGRIVSASILLLALSMAILGYLSYSNVSRLVTEDVDRYSMLKVSASADKVAQFVRAMKVDLESTAPSFSEINEQSEIMSRLKQISALSDASAIVVGYQDGSAFNSNKGRYDASSYDPRVRGWYKSAKSQRKTVITDIYTGKSTGTLMISIATPFYKGSALAGVLLADIELTILKPIVEEMVFDGAMAALYDGTGLTIASTGEVDVPGKSRLSDFADLVPLEKEMLSKDQGVYEYSLLGMDKVAYFQTIELDDRTKWHVLVGLDKSVVYHSVAESFETTVITTLSLVVFSALAIYLILSYAYKPVIALKQTVNELSSGNGDLTQRLPVASNDDLGQISRDINTFIESLQKMMLDISDMTNRIGDSVGNLQTQTDENRRVLSEHQSETEMVVTSLDEMSATSNDVAQNTAEAVEFTGNTNSQTDESKNSVSHASGMVLELVNKVEDAASQINQMGGDINEITNVLKVIGEIAEQTNLLALNAAIEAARAGEHGRGFAVVADEVRALASRTQDSTTEIQNTINRLTSSSESVIDAMNVTRESCVQASTQANQVVEDLDVISQSVDGINNLNVQIATAAEQQNSVAAEITQNMAKMSDMVQRVAESGDQVNSEASNLAQANSQLTEIVNQFKLR